MQISHLKLLNTSKACQQPAYAKHVSIEAQAKAVEVPVAAVADAAAVDDGASVGHAGALAIANALILEI